MANRDQFYSRMVAWLKILLPLAALALLSTLFLISRGRDHTGTLPFSQVDLRERVNEQAISAPQFSGATANGDLISFTAETARPDSVVANLAHVSKLRAKIELTSTVLITFRAEQALLNTQHEEAELTDGVVIESSTGYIVRSDDLRTKLARIDAETTGPVRAIGPPGEIQAGLMRLTADPETHEVQLLFTNGVKLLYQPQN